jgi:hypothetical protein
MQMFNLLSTSRKGMIMFEIKTQKTANYVLSM